MSMLSRRRSSFFPHAVFEVSVVMFQAKEKKINQKEKKSDERDDLRWYNDPNLYCLILQLFVWYVLKFFYCKHTNIYENNSQNQNFHASLAGFYLSGCGMAGFHCRHGWRSTSHKIHSGNQRITQTRLLTMIREFRAFSFIKDFSYCSYVFLGI